MPDPHWDNLKEIFHAAVALPPDERSVYLDRVCDGNDSLRQAVESLIKSHEESGNFVDKPAYQAAAEMLVEKLEFTPGNCSPLQDPSQKSAKAGWARSIWLKIRSCIAKSR